MLAHMHNCVRAPVMAQPEIERQIVVRRHQIRGVVGVGGINVIAARRLQRDDGVSIRMHRQRKPVVAQERIILWRAPTLLHLLFYGPWQRIIMALVNIQRQNLPAAPIRPIREPVRRPLHHRVHQCLGVVRNGHAVAVIAQQSQNMHSRRRRIEPNAIRQPPVFVGIIGKHKGDLFIRLSRGAKCGPTRRKLRDPLNAVANSAVGGNWAFGCLIEIGFTLKANRAGQDAAIDLRKGDVHGDIAR